MNAKAILRPLVPRRVRAVLGRHLRSYLDLAQARALVDSLGGPDNPAFLEKVRSVWVRFPRPPRDPWASAYRQHWLDVYRSITGATYNVQSEGSHFDVEAATTNPFPYCTRSHDVVGSQFIGLGSLIRAMQLPPGAKILEFGPGWGNTTLALAQMGYDVTAIDIEPNYVALIRSRAAKLGVSVNVQHGDFFSAGNLNSTFDAVLFYESFHHCDDHLRLLEVLKGLLPHGGKLVLAGETVNESLPYDWGLNPNGEALWQIAHNGWLELAFRESYLLRTLRRFGWETERHPATVATGLVYIARKA